MRRSDIDALIREAAGLLADMGIALPPQAHWDLPAWFARADDARELGRRGIGWDLTDFGSGDFHRVGLLCYTLSNGVLDGAGRPVDQSYANKLLVVREGQVTPMHHHWRKVEDIAVLGGGNLQVRLGGVGPGDAVDRASEVRILRNNIWESVAAGEVITLWPGERVRVEQHHYHEFWGEPGNGTVVAEEVSTVNDDAADNCFAPGRAGGRFPAIDEDKEPRYLLCTELPGTAAFARLVERYVGGDGAGPARD